MVSTGFFAIDGLIDIMKEFGDGERVTFIISADITVFVTVTGVAIIIKGGEDGMGQLHDELTEGHGAAVLK